MLWFISLFLLFLIPTQAISADIDLLLSWDLKPYWEFVEGFQKARLFKTHVEILGEKADFQAKGKIFVAVGHRALRAIQQKPALYPFFAALILHPSLAGKPAPRGGVYLLLPPEIIFSSLKRALQSLLKKERVILGIPYSTPFNQKLIEEAAQKAPQWGFEVIPVSLKEGLWLLNKAVSKIDVLYFWPDPFWESREVIVKVIEQAILQRVIVVGFNNFFLSKGALLAFVIDYRKAGYRAAFLVKDCLESSVCYWEPAPFNLKLNEKLKEFYSKGP